MADDVLCMLVTGVSYNYVLCYIHEFCSDITVFGQCFLLITTTLFSNRP